jgi:hypothetical protein
MTNNQIKKSIEGNYFSTNAFVGINNLEEVAENVLGKGWEAEDDCAQIQAIIEHLNIGRYNVKCEDEDIVVEEVIINHHNSYGVFCMANIIGVNTRELDIIWDKEIEVYNLFAESKFNVDTMSELDCMELFYKDYKDRQEFLNSGTYIMDDKRVRDIVHNAINELKTIDIDGETMEFIIKNLNMEDQMLSQLGYLLRVENESLKYRLGLILEDQVFIRDFININAFDIFNKPTIQCDTAITHLNNIEIACDLNSNESLAWSTKS